jgi:hypothetical protein
MTVGVADERSISVERSPTRCPYCHENVDAQGESWIVCASCLARHHAACWRDHGRCAACDARAALETPAPARSALARRSNLIVGVAVLLLLGILAFRHRPGTAIAPETTPPAVGPADPLAAGTFQGKRTRHVGTTKLRDASPDAILTLAGEAAPSVPPGLTEDCVVEVSPDRKRALLGMPDGRIRLIDAASGETRGSFSIPGPVREVGFSRGGERGLAATPRGVTVLDLATGKVLLRFGEKEGDNGSVAFSHDGRFAVSWRTLGRVAIWDVESGDLLDRLSLAPRAEAVTTVAWAQDDRTFLAGVAPDLALRFELTRPGPLEAGNLVRGLDQESQELALHESVSARDHIDVARRAFLDVLGGSAGRVELATALDRLRADRSKASVPLLLEMLYLADDGLRESAGGGRSGLDEICRTLTLISGKWSFPPSRGSIEETREFVHGLVASWWTKTSSTLATDLAHMNAEQRSAVLDALVQDVRQGFVLETGTGLEDPDGLHAIMARVSPQACSADDALLAKSDLVPEMVPLLVDMAEDRSCRYPAIRLLSILRARGLAPDLERVLRADQTTGTGRLAAILALYEAGEPLRTDDVVALLGRGLPDDVRLAAILCLAKARDASAVVPALVKIGPGDVQEGRAALLALEDLPRAPVLAELDRILGDDADTRELEETRGALRALGRLPDAQGDRLILGFLARALDAEPLRDDADYLRAALAAHDAATGERTFDPEHEGAKDSRFLRACARALLTKKGLLK